jgi:DNA-binding beta-propeller fold protein YncE
MRKKLKQIYIHQNMSQNIQLTAINYEFLDASFKYNGKKIMHIKQQAHHANYHCYAVARQHYQVLLYLLLITCFMRPAEAHADGGAPNLAYVASAGANISIIDVIQQKVTRTISTAGNPHALLLSIDGQYLYSSQPQQGRVMILAANTGNTICTTALPGHPAFLALDTSTNSIYAAGHSASMITALDATNCKVKRTFQTQAPINGIALAFADANLSEGQDTQLWATTTKGVEIFHTTTGQPIKSVSMSDEPQAISIPPGKTAYVTTHHGTIKAIDTSSYQSMIIMKGGSYGPMDFDELTGELYVPDLLQKQLLILSPVTIGFSHTREPSRSIHFSTSPTSVAITSDGQLGFVSLQNGQVSMLDLPGKQTIATIPVKGSPNFIITGVYPPLAPTNLQEVTLSGILVSILAYGLIAIMLIGPTIYFLYSRQKHRHNSPKGTMSPT